MCWKCREMAARQRAGLRRTPLWYDVCLVLSAIPPVGMLGLIVYAFVVHPLIYGW